LRSEPAQLCADSGRVVRVVAYLVDTSILVRLANFADGFHSTASQAVLELHRQGQVLHVTAQNLIEFRSVATRPATVNGLGLTSGVASTKSEAFGMLFPLLEETPDIYPAWKSLVTAGGIIGKQVHDARLVAVCQVHRVSHLLTFNTAHFLRLTSFGSGLLVVDPASL